MVKKSKKREEAFHTAIEKVLELNKENTAATEWNDNKLTLMLCKCLYFCSQDQVDFVDLISTKKKNLLEDELTSDSISNWLRKVGDLYAKHRSYLILRSYYVNELSAEFLNTFGFGCYSSYLVVDVIKKNNVNTLSFVKIIDCAEPKLSKKIWLVACKPHNYIFPMNEHDVYMFIYNVRNFIPIDLLHTTFV